MLSPGAGSALGLWEFVKPSIGGIALGDTRATSPEHSAEGRRDAAMYRL